MNFTKSLIIAVLAAVNSAVITLGLWFTSANISGQTIPVFGVEIPAFLLGFAIIYIGVRSLIKLFRLYNKLKDPELKFSWQNFKGGM